jgi:hypothetical protein
MAGGRSLRRVIWVLFDRRAYEVAAWFANVQYESNDVMMIVKDHPPSFTVKCSTYCTSHRAIRRFTYSERGSKNF